ncbi:MAG: BlaI/MecI/CopY family transcriptional regulator [Bdellovibrio sp.]
MKKIPSLGEQEMEILKYINANSPVSVRDVASHFEVEKNLARTTVLTVMERLRKKGFLSRAQQDGVFKYTAKIETEDLLSSKVSNFVEKTLGGSVGPLFNYFISSAKLSEDEISKLREMASKIEKTKESK